MNNESGVRFDNTYTELNQKMFTRMSPNNNSNSIPVIINNELALELGLSIDFLNSEEGVSFLSGNSAAFGPLYSQAYAGHQYGHFTMLGDGRAVMLGEQTTPKKERYDIQLKGSGRTPYSRRGDGKATLYSMLREYLISEAMNALGIPTSRSLAVVKTNELVQRQNVEQGAILARVAKSHIRVGTFEFARVYGDKSLVKELADYTIKRHYPELDTSPNKYTALLGKVIKEQASLVSKWQSFGFIHGVMNTDNVLLSGETIDYGPCAFIDKYDPNTVFSSIDKNGRYAYKNQPYIASWNMSRFAEAILDLLDDNQEEAIKIANKELKKFEIHFKQAWLTAMGNKLGIQAATQEDEPMILELLELMEKNEADFTNTFSLLTQDRFENIKFYGTEEWSAWFQKWTRALGYRQMDVRARKKLMEQSNPIIIPRNHLVEEALQSASKSGDYTQFDTLLTMLQDPFDYTVEPLKKYTESANVENYVTYCGT